MGNEVKFTFGDQTITIKEGMKLKKKLLKELDPSVASIFNAIANSDANGKDNKVDKTELDVFKKLAVVFNKLGDWNKNGTPDFTDIKDYCQDVYNENRDDSNINSEIVEAIKIQYSVVTSTTSEDEIAIIEEESVDGEVPGGATLNADGTDATGGSLEANATLNADGTDATSSVTVEQTTTEAPVSTEIEIVDENAERLKQEKQARLDRYNDYIQTKVSALDVEFSASGDFKNVYTVKSGQTLYGIAKDDLIKQGVESPTVSQINIRIAEIAYVNGIDNVNVIKVGQEIRLTNLGEQQTDNINPNPVEIPVAPKVNIEVPEGTPRKEDVQAKLDGINTFLEDVMNAENANVTTTTNNDGTKTTVISLNDERRITAKSDAKGNITEIQFNLDSNLDYSDDKLGNEIVVKKGAIEVFLNEGANQNSYSINTGFNFDEFVNAFKDINDVPDGAPNKEAVQTVYEKKDSYGRTFKAADETVLNDFIVKMNDNSINRLEIIKEFYNKDSQLLNSIIENNVLLNTMYSRPNAREELMALILKEDIVSNLSQESLAQLSYLANYYNKPEWQDTLNSLNPLKEKFNDVANLTPQDLENAEKTRLVSTIEHEGVKVYNHNNSFYKVDGETVQEVPFAEAKAMELVAYESDKNFEGWYEASGINKDNIIEILKTYQANNSAGLISTLNDKKGISANDMSMIVKTLLEKADEYNLQDESVYKDLAMFSSGKYTTRLRGDYIPADAKIIDKNIGGLIKLIEEKQKEVQ